jgi:hypothetical protein
MNHDELEAIRARVRADGRPPDGALYWLADRAALLAELDRKTLLLERYGARLEEVRNEVTSLEDAWGKSWADRCVSRLRQIVGPR